MAQNPNPTIKNFRLRVAWVVRNLDPDPMYLRFVSEVNDIFFALEEAVAAGTFAVAPQERVPGKRVWEIALRSDGVPRVYLEWLYTLYPDLVPEHFEVEELEKFTAYGKEIATSRERWRPAIRYFAENRSQLSEVARKFYRDIDQSSNLSFGELEFPLLTKIGWIRAEPLHLTEHTEGPSLRDPSPGRMFEPCKLTGLRGEYVAYKGALSYASRRMVKAEPQHNGEILCVESVVMDEKYFSGFRFYIARYFDYINTCEILGAELADWVLSNSRSDSLPSLPLRGEPIDAFDFENRAAYPGVNCLTIFLNYSEARLPRGNYFLLHKRDETQLQAQNSVHVVPAGGHQGYAKGAWREDTAIWRTVLREFCEELFDQENLYKQPETWENFLDFKDVRKIKQIFFDEPTPAARVYLHGFGLDPLTLKPEILITIVINWRIVREKSDGLRLKYNWELQRKRKKSGTRHQWAELSKRQLLRQAAGGVQSIGDTFLYTLPAGAACMMQAARHYEFLQLPGH